MAAIVEAATPQLEHWNISSGVAESEQSRSSTPSQASRQNEKVPVEIKQELGFVMKRPSELLFHQQYLSDEEGLSPIEHDDTLSVEDDSDDCDDVEFDKDLAELAITYEYTAKACTQALIISIKPVRPKMVQVSQPSSPSGKSSPNIPEPSKSEPLRESPALSASSFESHARRSLSSSYSQTRRNSSIPLMESAAEARAVSAVFLPPPGPSPQHSFLDSDPFSKSALPVRSPSTHSRLRSLSKTISFAKLASRKTAESVQSPTTPVKTKESPSKTKENGSRMKLVPRGAGEREPVLQLPEFPGMLDDEAPAAPLSATFARKPWPERTDSKEKGSKLKKRKSLVFG
ncbi:MAG: hypothetical protein M1822_002792 [Bathelium mastoideum]|nr:MAG: hypothetical protein M1822_002792 [Bathelium mastoideum]